ncbi:MAG: hypothetical protein QM790_14995 [Nibricoccus sp.]
MRITILAVLALVVPLAGCRLLSFKKSDPAEAPVAKSDPGNDYGAYPNDFQQRTIDAFQAKWPADVIYQYRFELPRRVENTYSSRYGYAVRFAAQKGGGNAFPSGLPWIAYFENGRIVWVQRASEVSDTLKWFDSPKSTVDWPPATAK